jgi:hypothetical protein
VLGFGAHRIHLHQSLTDAVLNAVERIHVEAVRQDRKEFAKSPRHLNKCITRSALTVPADRSRDIGEVLRRHERLSSSSCRAWPGCFERSASCHSSRRKIVMLDRAAHRGYDRRQYFAHAGACGCLQILMPVKARGAAV